jgi:Flp pilus assembly protein TadG
MMLLQRLRRFGFAKKGSAAVEFALIAPMMMFLVFGSVDLLDALNLNKRVQNATASVADVAARDTEISTAEIDNFWAALDVLMFPTDGDAVRIRISSVRIASASSATVVWSRSHGGMSQRSNGSTVALQSAMMTPGTSLIMTETEYDYRSPLGFLMAAPITLKHVAYRRSRLVDPIPCTWNGCS